ncbi:MAG: hypothetical protein AAGA90_00535 [Actinomycetota bacterium]
MNEIENPMTPNDPTQTDQILESLRPRMRDARIAHVRRLAAVVAVVPLLGFGAAAMAAGGPSTSTEIETAVGPADDDVDLPEIGAGDAAEVAVGGDEVPVSDEPTDTTTTSTTTTVAPDPDAPTDIDLGVLGWVEVKPGDAAFDVVGYDLAEGWEVINSEVVDGSLALLLSNGDTMKVVVIEPGPRDEILVSVDEFVPPTTTTTTIKPEPVDEPTDASPDPVVDSFTVDVPGKGSFTVTRNGDTLSLGTVSVNDGYSYDVVKDHGWKVHVAFTDGETIFNGKAWLNEGVVEIDRWEENVGPQPVYEYVYVDGVGMAKFEAYDGQIRVYRTEQEAGFTATDHFAGGYAATGKVTFEGNDQVWTVDAWLDENGALVWSITQS